MNKFLIKNKEITKLENRVTQARIDTGAI